ncbi:undecaprenyl-phosphate glucose phosphotransferase [Flavobacterium sp.]|uniref:undecaprenyl-phosphate glucose phosphotransferase n=1 Tax=Flavobacterium sp. TaxID=239 RepID=UPI003BDDC93E
MTAAQSHSYSKYIRPISILFDLLVISTFCVFFFQDLNLNKIYYILYQTFSWGLIAYFIKFYEVFRFTTPVEIATKLITQIVLFLLVIIAFFPFSNEAIFSSKAILFFGLISFILITIFKIFLFYYLKKYRIITGSNYRNAIIIGYSSETIKLKELFEARKDYGYRFFGYFSNKKNHPEVIGKLEDIKTYVIENEIDEIYCSLNELSNEKLKDLVDFADEFKKAIKFIPDSKEIFSKNLRIDYYEMFPVLSLKKTILNEPSTKIFKRIFDIVFALIVIIGILSWLVPILAILIKLESKGPIFFKQGRPGLNEKEFFCYKFRSMKQNETTEKEASKNDPRVTKIGKFMRKTSMDELPQFLNVLLGDMSVVGPRPHLWSQNKIYGSRIKKYMVRHYVKPGITGLAQVKGFRGEIENDEEMINRIKFDVFYIENWSLILDIKIIVQTVINIYIGEDKAY